MALGDAQGCKVFSLIFCKQQYKLPTLPLLVYRSLGLEGAPLKRAAVSSFIGHLVLPFACLDAE